MSKVLNEEGKNRFKFKSFSEQLEDIEIKVFKNRSHISESEATLDPTFSFFHDGLEYWQENNLSNDYFLFFKSATSKINANLATVLFYKQDLANLLLEGLRKHDGYAIIPMINLSCLLAKDLRDEFYSEFGIKFFAEFAQILKKSSDVAVIEATYLSISWIFKFITKEIIKDFSRVFSTLECLFFVQFEKRPHHPKFLAEAMSFLYRRGKDQSMLSTIVTDRLDLYSQKKENVEISTYFLFCCVKGVAGALNSSFSSVLEFTRAIPDQILREEFILCFSVKLFAHTVSKESLSEEIFKSIFVPEFEGLRAEVADSVFSSSLRLLHATKGKYREEIFHLFAQHAIPLLCIGEEQNGKGIEFFLRLISTCTSQQELEQVKAEEILLKILRAEASCKVPLWISHRLSLMLPRCRSLLLAALGFIEAKEEKDFDASTFCFFHFLCQKGNISSELQANSTCFSFEQKVFLGLFRQEEALKLLYSESSSQALNKGLLIKWLSEKQERYSGIGDPAIFISFLASQDSTVRKASLSILSFFESSSVVISELLRCEEVASDMQNYRQKLIHLRNADIYLKSAVSDSTAIASKLSGEILVNFLVGSVMDNFLLFRKEAVKIVSSLCERFKVQFAGCWEREMRSCFRSAKDFINPAKASRAIKVYSLCEFPQLISDWHSSVVENGKIHQENPSSKVVLLFEAAVQVPSAVSSALNFVIDSILLSEFETNQLVKQNLKSILSFISQCSIPSQQNSKLENFLLEMLMKPDPQLQELCLDSLFSIASSSFPKQGKAIMLELANEKTFKEQLLSISLKEEAQLKMDPNVRKALMPLILRVLFGKTSTKMQKAGETILRRKAIFRFFSSCTVEEVKILFEELIFKEFSHSASTTQIIGLLTNLKEVISQLGGFLADERDLFRQTLNAVLYCLNHSNGEKRIRNLALKRLASLFSIPHLELDGEIAQKLYQEFLDEKVVKNENFVAESLQKEGSSFVKMFTFWSLQESYALVLFRCEVIQKLASALSVAYVPLQVKREIVQVFNVIPMQLFTLDILPSIWIHLKQLISTLNVERQVSFIELILNLIFRLQDFLPLEFTSFLCTFMQKNSKFIRQEFISKLFQIIEKGSSEANADLLFEALCPFFLTVEDPQARKSLVSVFLPFLAEFPKEIVAGLNAFVQQKRIGEIDYNSRLAAFSAIKSSMQQLAALEWNQLKVLLLNLAFFLGDATEYAFRSNASETLCCFIRNYSLFGESWNQIQTLILSSLKRLLRGKDECVKEEVVAILAEILKHSPKSPLDTLKGKDSILFEGEDEETTFFSNIFHLQVHRRTRTVTRLTAFIKHHEISSAVLTSYFVPILSGFIFNQGTVQDSNLISESINGLAICYAYTNSSFKKIIHFLKLLNRQPEREKIALKLVIAICNSIRITTQQPEITLEYVKKTVLPALFKNILIKKGESEILRSPLALAILHLLLKCDNKELLQENIPKLVLGVGNAFKSRSQNIRTAARATLVRMISTLGPEYATFIFKELASILNREGYHRDVLMYTLNALLQVIDQCSLESCKILLQTITIPFIMRRGKTREELAGDQNIKTKMTESKVDKSFSILQRTIQIIPDLISFEAILQMLKDTWAMYCCNSQADRSLFQRICESFSLGLSKNTHFSPSELAIISFSLLKVDSTQVTEGGLHFFHQFALSTLKGILKKGSLENDSTLVPFVEPIYHLVLGTGNTEVLSLALKCLHLMKQNFPLLEEPISQMLLSPQMLEFLFDKVGHVDSALFSTSIKILASLIDGGEVNNSALGTQKITLDSQIKKLIIHICQSNDALSRHSFQDLPSVLSILKVAIKNEIIFPEMYDISEKQLFSLCITHPQSFVREQARGVFVAYLLGYPLTAGRIQNVFSNLLVRNLSFEVEDGRNSCVEMLSLVLGKLPLQEVEKVAEFLTLNLTLRLVNEQVPAIISTVKSCLQQLLTLVQRRPAMENIVKLLATFIAKRPSALNEEQDNSLTIVSAALRTISCANAKVLSQFDSQALNEAIQCTFPLYKLATLQVLKAFLQNGFKPSEEVWNECICFDLTLDQSISFINEAISLQLEIFTSKLEAFQDVSLAIKISTKYALKLDISPVVERFVSLFQGCFAFCFASKSSSSTLEWIIKKICGLPRLPNLETVKFNNILFVALKVLEFLSTQPIEQLPEATATVVIQSSMSLLYFLEVGEAFQKKDHFGELGELIAAVRASLKKNHAFSEAFHQAYQTARTATDKIRTDRRIKRKTLAVADPAAHALKKIRKSAAK